MFCFVWCSSLVLFSVPSYGAYYSFCYFGFVLCSLYRFCFPDAITVRLVHLFFFKEHLFLCSGLQLRKYFTSVFGFHRVAFDSLFHILRTCFQFIESSLIIMISSLSVRTLNYFSKDFVFSHVYRGKPKPKVTDKTKFRIIIRVLHYSLRRDRY